MELLPTKATFLPGEQVEVEVRGLETPTTVTLRRLHRTVAEQVVGPGDPVARFGTPAEGGYGVDADGATSALDVLANPFRRLRYGFVSHYEPGRDVAGVSDNVRRLHLNAVQFYDWMYRHAELLPPQDEFEDALGRPISLATVRALAAAVRDAGSAPLGYAAVYAAGREHWPSWRDEGLFHADGSPWQLGDDFLWNVDPSSERWLAHFAGELAVARERAGFAGFHLDQFGAPKRAQRADGSVVDLAEALPALIERMRRHLPDARLIFNNVNDFPTWTTASTPQDAVYIEVWSPHDGLQHLGGLVAKAKALAPDKPVALAAYLSTYDGDEAAAREAMRLELATVLSHGGTCLLHGEEDAVLTDPYYVRHHRMDAESAEAARAYADFGVRYGDLLFDAVDVTRSHSGGVNIEAKVEAGVRVSTDCEAGSVWARVLEGPEGQVVSLIDLSGQDETAWDAPKRAAQPLGGVTVALERAGAQPRFYAAAPDAPVAVELRTEFDGRYDRVRVPEFRTWSLVWTET
jgi:dextranase